MDLRNVVRTLSIALLGAAILLPEPASAARCRSGLTTDGRIAVRQRCVSPVSDRPSASVPTPMVEGPVTGGGGAPVVQATSFDLADVGYMVEEFFLAGTAEAYVNVEPLRSNGRWSISPGSIVQSGAASRPPLTLSHSTMTVPLNAASSRGR